MMQFIFVFKSFLPTFRKKSSLSKFVTFSTFAQFGPVMAWILRNANYIHFDTSRLTILVSFYVSVFFFFPIKVY